MHLSNQEVDEYLAAKRRQWFMADDRYKSYGFGWKRME